jgi:sec-independent protein translocase protein TatB
LFGLSWDQIILIVLAGLFLLGPERIPTAMKWLMESLRKLRTFAAGAQSEMRSQLGPELDELRRQIAELQSLKELKELRELRDLDPRRMVGKTLLGDEFSGGVKGFLGLNGTTGDGAAGGNNGGGPASSGAGSSAPDRAQNGAVVAAPAPGEPEPSSAGSVLPASQPPAAPSGAGWVDAEFT